MKLSRSEQKRFDEAHKVAFNRMSTPGSAFPTDTLNDLYDEGLIDLRSPARKAAEARVIQDVREMGAYGPTCYVRESMGQLNAIIASESAPSVEWRKRFLVDSWGVESHDCGHATFYTTPDGLESTADVLVAHLNKVERGKR